MRKRINGCLGCGLAFFVLLTVFMVVPVFFRHRTIDRMYASYAELEQEPCTRSLLTYLPHSVTDIHYRRKMHFGELVERVTCRARESDVVRFAEERSYVLATNSFTKLDDHLPEGGGDDEVRRWRERHARDFETQRRLVFGEKALPARYLSLTQSHAFDEGATGGAWRVILVFDCDTGVVTGYHWETWM